MEQLLEASVRNAVAPNRIPSLRGLVRHVCWNGKRSHGSLTVKSMSLSTAWFATCRERMRFVECQATQHKRRLCSKPRPSYLGSIAENDWDAGGPGMNWRAGAEKEPPSARFLVPGRRRWDSCCNGPMGLSCDSFRQGFRLSHAFFFSFSHLRYFSQSQLFLKDTNPWYANGVKRSDFLGAATRDECQVMHEQLQARCSLFLLGTDWWSRHFVESI